MRFIPQLSSTKSPVWTVCDTRAAEFHMPSEAITIYLSSYESANSIANVLNSEWAKFESNPN